MPESHLNFRYPAKKKVIRRAPVSPEAGTRGKTVSQRAQTSPARYRQIARSRPGYRHPTIWRKYRITGHPEKFTESDLGRGQTVDRRGSGDRQRVQGQLQKQEIKLAVLNLLAHHPIGRGLEAANAEAQWEKVAPILGGGKMPRLDFETSLGKTAKGGTAAGRANIGSGKNVKILDSYSAELLPLVPKRDAYRVLTHEWAHTRQPEAMKLAGDVGRRMAEGGAESFAQVASRLLGARVAPPPGEYQKYVNEWRHRLGRGATAATMLGQFPNAVKKYQRRR